MTRRPPSNRLGTPSRSSHSVIRLPPPWTRTTGRRRATAATSSRTCAWSAIVVPPSLTTRISLTSCTREFSMHVRPRSGRSRRPRRVPSPRPRSSADQRAPGASIAVARRRAVEGDRAARGAVEHEVAGDRDPEPRRDRAWPGVPAADRASRPRRPAASRTAASASRALPAAPAIRPQFGSRPWAAALTRLDETTARATARALGVVGRARSPGTVMSVVAPSPSAACWRARSRATASIARAERGRRRATRPAPARRPPRPDARTKTVSFVLVSPSTESWSQVRAAAGRSSAAERRRVDGRVGQHDRQHRRHPRVDHPDALGDAA